MSADLPAYVCAGYKHVVTRPRFVVDEEDEDGNEISRPMTPRERRLEVARCVRINASRNWSQFVRSNKSLARFDDIMKCYYHPKAIEKLAADPNPFLAFVRKA